MKVVDKRAYFAEIGYKPHPKQWLYHMSRARFRAAVCGRRFGKSVMAGRDTEPELLIPNRRFWIVGPTYDLGEKEFRVIWDDLIVGKSLGKDKRVKKAYNKRSGEMYIELPWQTRLEVRSADHPDGLVGESLDGVIMSEAAKHKVETWERYIRPALADRRGWGVFPTTPEGFNWLYNIWQFGQNPDLPDYASWQFPSWENPYVYPGGRDDPEIKLIEKTTTYEWFLQEIAADFASFVGKIYSEFEEKIHVKKHVYNPNWPNYIAFDWGYTHPLAAIEFQVSPWDDVHVWREHYGSYKTLETHLEEMKARKQPKDYKIDLCFGDAADPEAAMYVSEHFSPCIANPESKGGEDKWRQGINLVKMQLRSVETGVKDEYGTPETAPKLFVDHSCQNLIREFNNYRAPDSKSVLTAKEMGQRVDDDGLDALRYGLMHVFVLGATHRLSETVDIAVLDSSESETFFTSGVSF